MNLSDLFENEEKLQLEKKTLVILRWIAIIGQLTTIFIVYFAFKFQLPFLYCLSIVLIGTLTNIYLQFFYKKDELSNLDSTIVLAFDLFQLGLLLFLTGGIKNPFVILNSFLFLNQLLVLRMRGSLQDKLPLEP